MLFMQFSIDVDSDKNHFVANFSSSKKQLLKIAVRGSRGQTSQSKVEPTKIDTKGFLANFGTESLLQSDFGKQVTSKMASNMAARILQYLAISQ